MFPIALDLTKIPVLLVGTGELFERRRKWLEEAGATRVTIITLPLQGGGQGGGQPAHQEDPHLNPPPCRGRKNVTAEDINNAAVVMVAGLPREQAQHIVEQTHAAGKLVNVEDINDLCDFYFTANVRRGDLVIAVSTSGASPTLARKVRDAIAGYFGEEWTGRVHEMANLRKSLKARGASMQEVIEKTESYLAEKGWLKNKDEAA